MVHMKRLFSGRTGGGAATTSGETAVSLSSSSSPLSLSSSSSSSPSSLAVGEEKTGRRGLSRGRSRGRTRDKKPKKKEATKEGNNKNNKKEEEKEEETTRGNDERRAKSATRRRGRSLVLSRGRNGARRSPAEPIIATPTTTATEVGAEPAKVVEPSAAAATTLEETHLEEEGTVAAPEPARRGVGRGRSMTRGGMFFAKRSYSFSSFYTTATRFSNRHNNNNNNNNNNSSRRNVEEHDETKKEDSMNTSSTDPIMVNESLHNEQQAQNQASEGQPVDAEPSFAHQNDNDVEKEKDKDSPSAVKPECHKNQQLLRTESPTISMTSRTSSKSTPDDPHVVDMEKQQGSDKNDDKNTEDMQQQQEQDNDKDLCVPQEVIFHKERATNTAAADAMEAPLSPASSMTIGSGTSSILSVASASSSSSSASSTKSSVSTSSSLSASSGFISTSSSSSVRSRLPATAAAAAATTLSQKLCSNNNKTQSLDSVAHFPKKSKNSSLSLPVLLSQDDNKHTDAVDHEEDDVLAQCLESNEEPILDLHASLKLSDWQALYQAIQELKTYRDETGDIASVLAALAYREPVHGETVLHVAVYKAPPALTLQLLDVIPAAAASTGNDKDEPGTDNNMTAKNYAEHLLLLADKVSGNVPLHLACACLDERVDFCILKNVLLLAPTAISKPNFAGDTPLHLLVGTSLAFQRPQTAYVSCSASSMLELGNNFHVEAAAEEAITCLLQMVPDLGTVPNKAGVTLLHAALAHGAHERVLVKLLTLATQAASIEDHYGMLPLHYVAAAACQQCNTTPWTFVGQLIWSYPDAIVHVTKHGDTPLHVLMTNAHKRCCGDNKDKSASGTVYLDRNTTKLAELLSGSTSSSVSTADDDGEDDSLSLSATSPLFMFNESNLTPLHCCAVFDTPAQLTRVVMETAERCNVAVKASVVQTPDTGSTPLHLACAKADPNMGTIEALATPQACLTVDHELQTPLFAVCNAQGDRVSGKLVELLMDKCPEAASKPGRQGCLALHVALKHRKIRESTIKTLVEAYPDSIRAVTHLGNTPLHVACAYGIGKEILEYLLKEYPDAIGEANGQGLTPYDLAKEHHRNHAKHSHSHHSSHKKKPKGHKETSPVLELLEKETRRYRRRQEKLLKSQRKEENHKEKKRERSRERVGRSRSSAPVLTFTPEANLYDHCHSHNPTTTLLSSPSSYSSCNGSSKKIHSKVARSLSDAFLYCSAFDKSFSNHTMATECMSSFSSSSSATWANSSFVKVHRDNNIDSSNNLHHSFTDVDHHHELVGCSDD